MKNKTLRCLSLIFLLMYALMAAGACYAEAGLLVLPEGLKAVEEEAFLGTAHIDTVIVQAGTEQIGSRAFAESSVKRIYLPESIRFIADDAFEECSELTAVASLGSYAEKYGIEHDLLMAYNDLYHHISDGSAVIHGYDGDETKTDLVLPEKIGGYTVTAIDQYTFSGNSYLVTVQFPDSITLIDDWAFFDCSNLARIGLPKNLQRIGEYAFFRCRPLTAVTIPDGVTSIGDYAFEQCSSLARVELPASLTSIGSGVFSSCSDSLVIYGQPGSLAETYANENGIPFQTGPETPKLQIAAQPESLCIGEGKVASFRIDAVGDGVQYQWYYADPGDDAFAEADAQGEVYSFAAAEALDGRRVYCVVTDQHGNSLASDVAQLQVITGFDYEMVDDECIITLYTGSDPEVDVPAQLEGKPVAGISENAFANAGHITSVSLPETVRSIGSRAFANCAGLQTIALPDLLNDIADDAFAGCANLTLRGRIGSFVEAYAEKNNIRFVYLSSPAEDFTCSISDGRCTITGYRGNDTAIVVPDLIGNCAVTGIGSYAFSGCANLERIILPDSIDQIGESAFARCTALERMKWPAHIPEISHSVFRDCANLAQVEIPEGVTAIQKEAFYGCSALVQIDLPDSLASIGEYAFDGCSGLTAIDIPDGVPAIAKGAFLRCTSLSSIHIPDSVTRIEDSAFSGCSGLSELLLPGSVTAIGQSAFSNCDGLTSVILPDGVVTIGNSAFSNCDGLLAVQLPNTVTTLGDEVFYGCTNLDTITIPASVNSIGAELFFHCRNLKNVIFLNEMTEIPEGMFRQCSGLERIHLPSGVTSIADWAFQNCYMLKEIEFPSNLVSIGNYAFQSCNALTSVTLPETVQTIGNYAFANCEQLGSVTLSKDLTQMGSYVFYWCQNLRNVAFVTAKLDRISESAFQYCTTLSRIDIPNGTAYIDKNAFRNCERLYCVTLPESLLEIGNYAFSSCAASLTMQGAQGSYAQTYAQKNRFAFRAISEDDQGILASGDYQYVIENDACTILDYTGSESNVVVPETIGGCKVTAIGPYAFQNTIKRLESIELPQTLTTIAEYAFYNCSVESVHLPDSLTTIHHTAFMGCSNLASMNYPASLKTITGVGVNSGSFFSNTRLTSIVVPEGVTELAAGAFCRCYDLKQVTLPSTLEKIGEYAFLLCESLKEIEIPDGVKQIDYRAFDGSGLESVVLPDSVVETGQSVFANCESLKSATISSDIGGGWTFADCSVLETVVLQEGITTLPYGLFENCTGLHSISLPDSLTTLGSDVFSGCISLEKIVLPDSVSHIGWDVFSGCTALQSINYPLSLKESYPSFEGCTNLADFTVPEGVTTIVGGFFSQLPALTEIRLPSTVVEIASGAFVDCHALTDVVIPDGVTTLGAKAFENCSELVSVHVPKAWTTVKGTSTPFYDCPGLTVLDLPEGLETIPFRGLKDMESLEQITLPPTLTTIGQYAFQNCTGLETITIPEGVALIDYGVFYQCSSLRSIHLPDSITAINDAFSGCDALEEINYPRSLQRTGYTYYSSPLSELSALRSIVVPEGVTTLPSGVFGGCDNLTEIQLPQTLQAIEDYAFYYCENLTSLELPDSVSSIAANAFRGCSGITEMTLPLSLASDVTALRSMENLQRVVIQEGITTLPAWLRECYALTEVVLPSTLTVIDANAFYNCQALTDIQLPEGLKSIGASAFYRCYGLTDMDLPSGVATINSSAFSYCTALTSISIPESTTVLPSNLFNGCSALVSVDLHDGIQTINDGVFSGCAMEQLTLPKSLTKLGANNLTGANLKTVVINAEMMNATASMNNSSPFAGSKISTFIISEGAKQIPAHAFRSCQSLTEIVLPDTLQTIGDYAFNGCTALPSIYLPDSLESIGIHAFDNCNALTAMNVPVSLRSVGNGTYAHPLLIRVVVSDGMTHLPNAIFSSCTALKAVHLPDSIRSIGASAFYGCSGLESVRLPQRLETIGSNAFYGCSGIKSLTIPAGLFAEESTTTFGGLTGLTSVTVADGAAALPDGAFSGCTSLRSVVLPASLQHIGYYAFANCTSLEGIRLPDGIASLEYGVFYGCSSLSSVNIPAGLTNYAGPYSGLFGGCTSLKTVHVPDGLTEIPGNLFYGSPALEYVFLPDTIQNIRSGAFQSCPNLKAIVLEPDMSENSYISSTSIDAGGASGVRYYAEEGSVAAQKVAVYGLPLSYDRFVHESVGAAAALNGAVYTADGSAAAEAVISIYEDGDDRPIIQTYSDEDGSWQASGLEFGLLYRITCEAEGMRFDEYQLYVCQPSHVIPDFTGRAADTETALTTTLGGRVVAQDGSAVPNAQILIYRHTSDMLEASTVTDASGAWTVSGLAQGVNYYVRCYAPPFIFTMQSCMTVENSRTLPDFVSQNEPKYLLTDAASILGGAEAASYALSINASSAWTAQTDGDWITLSQTSGDQGAIVNISLAENAGVLRTGSILIRADGAESAVYVTQTGMLSASLPAPVITCPALDGEVMPFGDLTVAWEQVPQAGWYVISLRDLTEDVLLLCHSAVSRDAAMQSLLTADHLVPGHEYRVAVGAVPAGENSDSSTVGWCERTFSIPAEVLPEDASLCGLVYAHDYAEETVDEAGNVVPAHAYTYPMAGVTVQVYAISGAEKTLFATALTGEDGSWLVEGCEVGVMYAVELSQEAAAFILLRAVPAAVKADVSNASALITTEPGLNDTGTQYGSLHEALAKHYGSIWNTELASASNGLFAEYFQYSSKSKAFSNENKRWEDSVSQVNFSWENARQTFVLLRNGTEFNKIKTTAFDGSGSLKDVRYVKSKKFAALFTGYIQIPADGVYSFRLTGDDGVELMIETEDGRKYSDKDWSNGSSQKATINELTMSQNQLCKLTIRYYNDSGDANLIFEWATGKDESFFGDSRVWTTVPQSALHHTGERVYTASIEAFDVTSELRAINEQLTASSLANSVGTRLVDKIVGKSFMSAFDLEDSVYNSWLEAAGDIMINNVLKRITEVCFEELTKKAFNPDLTAKEIGEDLLTELKALLPENKQDELDSISIDASKSFGFIIDVLRFVKKHMADEYNTVISKINQNVNIDADLYMDASGALFGTTDLLDAAEKAMKEFSSVKKLVDFFADGVEAAEKLHDSDRVRSYIHLRMLEDPRGNSDLLENVLTYADGGTSVIHNVLNNNPWNTFDVSSLDRAHNDSLCEYFYDFADSGVEELVYKQLLLDTFGFMASGFAY